MSEEISAAEHALTRLLSLADNGKIRQYDATLPSSRINGYPFKNYQILSSFHEELKIAQSAGVISIEWKKHYEGHELVRIRLIDKNKLSSYLGQELLSERVSRSLLTISSLQRPGWLQDLLSQIEPIWLSGKSFFKIKPADTDTLNDVILAVNAIDQMSEDEVLDYRQFGARILNNSKRLKEIAGSLADIYRHRLDLQIPNNNDVLAQLNLVPLSHPVFIKGPISVGNRTHTINANVNPYLGIPFSLLEHISLESRPNYILTVENLSSFNEYTRSINDNGIIIFTSGYPTRLFQKFYKSLVDISDVKIFHWGDTDPHGFQILKTLQICISGRIVHPHLMNIKDGAEYTPSDISHLKKIIPVNDNIDKLLFNLIERKIGKIEQENIHPIPPID